MRVRVDLPVILAVLALVGSACAVPDAATSASSSPSPATATAPGNPAEPTGEVPHCRDVPELEVDDSLYGDSPIYVGNEMPTDAVAEWARSQPGFQDLWIDRDHNGWITVAFSEGVGERRADLDRLFPDDGVVAVEVDWNKVELEQLQQRVGDELADLESFGVGVDIQRGVVTIFLGVLTDDLRSRIDEAFGDDPVCVEGDDPADVPAPGPQHTEGPGWRLLAAEQGVGKAYHTAIAADQAGYEQLWAEAGVSGEPPEVDFFREVVVWFGAVYGSSCPDLRLDDVVVGNDPLHAEIVLVDPPAACTDDANPYAFIVALDRDDLPPGPFAIQLGAEPPPAGAPEERTLVDADLHERGATLAPGDVSKGVPDPRADFIESGEVLEPGFASDYVFWTHCGIEYLGEFNDFVWRTDTDMPDAWRSVIDENEEVVVSLLLEVDPPSDPTLTASANGVDVIYTPTSEPLPACY